MDINALLDELNRGTAISCSDIIERQTVLQYLSERGGRYVFPSVVDEIRRYGKSKGMNCLSFLYVMKEGTRDGKIVISLFKNIGGHDYIPYSVFEEITAGSMNAAKLNEPDEAEFNDGIIDLLFG